MTTTSLPTVRLNSGEGSIILELDQRELSFPSLLVDKVVVILTNKSMLKVFINVKFLTLGGI